MRKCILFVHLFNDLSGSPRVLSSVMKVTKEKGYANHLLTSKSELSFFDGLSEHATEYDYAPTSNILVALKGIYWYNYIVSSISVGIIESTILCM